MEKSPLTTGVDYDSQSSKGISPYTSNHNPRQIIKDAVTSIPSIMREHEGRHVLLLMLQDFFSSSA